MRNKAALLFCMCLYIGCEMYDSKLILHNNRSHAISFWIDYDSSFNAAGQFSKKYSSMGKVIGRDYIGANMEFHVPSIARTWEVDLSKSPNKTLFVCFIDSFDLFKDSATLVREKLITAYYVNLNYLISHIWAIEIR